MCRHFCIKFIGFVLKGKSFIDYTNLFYPNDYEKSNKIFSIIKKMKKVYCVICGKYRKFEESKISYILEKY